MTEPDYDVAKIRAWRNALSNSVESGIVAELEKFVDAHLPAPTMADVEWDYEKHYLGEAIKGGDTVIMLGGGKYLIPGRSDIFACQDKDLTPTGRKYRLEPEDDIPASLIEDKTAPDPTPSPEDVPQGEVWQVEVYRREAIGYRDDPGSSLPWAIVFPDTAEHDWLGDSDVTLVARLVSEATYEEASDV